MVDQFWGQKVTDQGHWEQKQEGPHIASAIRAALLSVEWNIKARLWRRNSTQLDVELS